MKFKDLTIGKTYKIDANETKGELQEGEYGIGFRIREKHEYKENPDGLVRFYLSSDIENDVYDYEEIESEQGQRTNRWREISDINAIKNE